MTIKAALDYHVPLSGTLDLDHALKAARFLGMIHQALRLEIVPCRCFRLPLFLETCEKLIQRSTQILGSERS
jgi:hypothetical protein